MALLDEVKMLKGIDDELQDELLNLIIEESEQRVLSYVNVNRSERMDEVPNDIKFIVRDVSVKRFNKLNSEGTTKDSEEGRSFDWEESYLAEYYPILDRYTDDEPDGSHKHGAIRAF